MNDFERQEDAPFAYEGLDRVLHEKARLGILTALLTARDGRSFAELRELCDLTDGNLNRHLTVLREANLVNVRRKGRGRGGQTTVRITAAGRRSFAAYLGELERVLRDARAAESEFDGAGADPAAT
ncbi:MAG: transcriptional regulator [Planctomycetota bacterium]